MTATFIVGTDDATDATGWSQYVLTGTNGVDWGIGDGYNGTGPRILLVSSLTGSPSGHGTVAAPYSTAQLASLNTRPGKPDWILLACNETYRESFQPRWYGPSSTSPGLVSNWNKSTFNAAAPVFDDKNNPPGSRPVCIPTGGPFFAGQGGGAAPAGSGENLAVIGLDFWGESRDPSTSVYNAADCLNTGLLAIEQANPYTWFLVENCRMRFVATAIETSFSDINTVYTQRHNTNLKWRRNVMYDCYMTRFNGGMMHLAMAESPEIKENFFDRNYNDSLTIAFNIATGSASAGTVYSDYAIVQGFIDDGSGNGTPSGIAGNVLTITATNNGVKTATSTGTSIVSDGVGTGTSTLTVGTLTNGILALSMRVLGASIPGNTFLTEDLGGGHWRVNGEMTVGSGPVRYVVADDGYAAPLYGTGITVGTRLTMAWLGNFQFRINANFNIGSEQIVLGPKYTVNTTISGATNIICTRTGTRPALNDADFPRADSGTLYKVPGSGAGDNSFTFSCQSLTFPSQYGFIHNLYHSAFGNEFDPLAVSQMPTFNSNITVRDPSAIQFRSGGKIGNNLWIRNPSLGAIGQPTTAQTIISNNVAIEAMGNASQNYESGWPAGKGYGWMYDQATLPIKFDTNIYCHTTRQFGGDGTEIGIGVNAIIQNEIWFDWNTPTLTKTPGGIKTYNQSSIVPGSGALAKMTFVGGIDGGQGVISTTSVNLSTVSGNITVRFTGTWYNVPTLFFGQPITLADSANPAVNQFSGTVVSITNLAFGEADIVINVTSKIGTATVSSWLMGGQILTVTSVTPPFTTTGSTLVDNGNGTSTFHVGSVTSGTIVPGLRLMGQDIGGASFILSGSGLTWLVSGGVGIGTAGPEAINGAVIGPNQTITWPGKAGGFAVNIWAMNDLSGWAGVGMTGSGGTGVYAIYDSRGSYFTDFVAAGTTFTIETFIEPMVYAPGHTGSGVDAYAILTITGPGGGVSSCVMYDTSVYEVPDQPAFPGMSYSAGDVLTCAVPGVSGFQVTVQSVSTVTESNNVSDPSGGNAHGYSHPERRLSDYMIAKGLGSTTDDFLNLWRNHEKANWNPDLTAPKVNDYFRANFDVSGGGGGGGGPTTFEAITAKFVYLEPEPA